MIGTGSVSGALRQLLIADNYAGGVMLGSFSGIFNAVWTGGNVHTYSEPDFHNSALGQAKFEHFNPATGLPLVNPESGNIGGVDIHNNSCGSYHNEW